MPTIGEHAVVIGAGIAGLTAAQALAAAYERVTLVERDTLQDDPGPRRAVPQGRHAHALLPRGQQCLEELFPGLTQELVAAGAPTYAAMDELRVAIGGHPFARRSLGLRSIAASRPFIERQLRRRVRALPHVDVLEGREVLGLTADAEGERVTGVRFLSRADGSAEETLAADLVVATTGRSARVPAWLESLGYEAPAEQRLQVGVTYASRYLRLPADALDGDKLVLVGARPGLPRTLFLFAQEGERWILSLGGYGEAHRPPADDEGFAAFAETVASPDVLEVIRSAEPLGEVATHAFPASVRRRYERVRRFPAGLLVMGDAMCSFNPIYGQGMTVAAAQAVALRRCLEGGERDLARRFFIAAAAPVGDAWTLSTGADLALPEVEGKRPFPVRLVNRYVRRLHAVAEHDPETAAAFMAVVGMRERPASLFRPRVAARVLRGPRPGRAETPVHGFPRPSREGVMAQSPSASGSSRLRGERASVE